MCKIQLKRWSMFWLCFLLINLGLLSETSLVRAENSPAVTLFPPYYAPNLPTGSPNHLIGIATHPWWLDMHLETFISRFKELKVGIVRLPVEWKVIEPAPGNYDWAINDRLLNRLNDEGFEVVAEFVTIPPWAASDPVACAKYDLDCGFNSQTSQRFEAAVEATARRYPFVRHWEFWNEPEQWPNAGRDYKLYGEWLKLFYRAIKRADPTMLVAATTLAGPDYITALYNYMDETLPGNNRTYPWDAIAYHPYNLDMEQDNGQLAYVSKKRIERLRQLMLDHNEGQKPIWITEIRFEGDPNFQSTQLISAFNWLVGKDYITMLALHMLHDWTEEAAGLMTTSPQTFLYQDVISPKTIFIPKQPYYDTFKNYPKRALPPPPPATADTLVFPQTGHTVRGIFKQTWEAQGGLALFGYPKTGQFYERNAATNRYYLVQYFERVRMEYHPEQAGTPYAVQFGLLGNEMMVAQGLLDGQGQPKAAVTLPEPPLSGSDNLFFRETGHNLSGQFLAAWRQYGGLTIIGLPRTSVYDQPASDGTVIKVQYFERARMELHSNANQQQFVLFGLLSNQRLVEQGRLDQYYYPPTDANYNYYNPANPEFAS